MDLLYGSTSAYQRPFVLNHNELIPPIALWWADYFLLFFFCLYFFKKFQLKFQRLASCLLSLFLGGFVYFTCSAQFRPSSVFAPNVKFVSHIFHFTEMRGSPWTIPSRCLTHFSHFQRRVSAPKRDAFEAIRNLERNQTHMWQTLWSRCHGARERECSPPFEKTMFCASYLCGSEFLLETLQSFQDFKMGKIFFYNIYILNYI